MKGRFLALAAGALLALAGTAQAAYRATDLGTLGGFSGAADVNSAGTVVGQSGNHPFVWTRAGGMVDLGVRGAADHVTEAGQVVGYAYVDDSTWHTFAWTPAGGLVDVGTLGAGNSSPWDVSDAGQIVGQSNWAGFPPAVKGYSWTAGGGMVDLGMLGLSVTIPWAVNEAGQVVGFSGKPFVWSAATGIQMLVPFSGGAADINDHGSIVGWAATPGGMHTMLWPVGGGSVDLGRTNTTTMAINDADEVVWLAKSDDGTTTRVMFRGPAGQSLDIGTLGGASTGIPTQFPGLALNDAGQVVGWSETADGARHAFVWSLAGGLVDLGPGQASAISANGLIVGTNTLIHPVLWEEQRDTTPPTLTTRDVAADATGPAGATVDYGVTASDDVDPAPTVVCAPASGSHFGIGDTTVECVATDAARNTATATFVVHVRDAAEQAANLEASLQPLPYGLATSLAAKLDGPTVERLGAFVHEVDAQAGKALTNEQAATLRTAAERVIAVLG